jgi:hypothetical protein
MSERDLSPPGPPDLQILVRREESDRLVFEARSDRLGHPNMDLGSVKLEGDTKALIQDELGRNVEKLSDLIEKDERNRDLAKRQLADLAVALFQKLPTDLRKLFWFCQGQIATIQILSDEPYFPWELLKLQGEGGEEGPFLCDAFSVTRWLRNRQTIGALPLQRIALVLPSDPNLPRSKGEKEDLVELVGSERVEEIPPAFAQVMDALAGDDYDGWHFAGHGSARVQDPDRAQLWLEGEGSLTPTNLVNAKANLSRLRPLIFLNGCDTGRAGFSLTGLGGWAYQSLAAGAGAFIGTLWPVRDKKARVFAQVFYKAFLGGEPFGEAVRQARLKVRDEFPGDPAWLAYTVYAHPGTVCSTATGKPTKRESQLSRLRIPDFEWRKDISPPGALLRAEYGIVPFHGRGAEESELHTWCTEGPSLRVRLYTGPGGMGKTRLAFEIAKALRKDGWRAGFLEQGRSPEEAWKAISRPGGRVLAIVDYAETRRELLVPLLRRLYATDVGPIRLILLARAALDWWEQLKTEGQGVGELLSGPATSRHALRSLAFTPQERSESYRLAGQAFAQKLNIVAVGEVPEDLGDSIYERVLLLHMRALATIEGIKVKGEDGVLDYVLNREQRYWTQRALDRKLTVPVTSGVSRAMAAITLGGGVDGETEAVKILRQLQAFKDHTGDVLLAVARMLHECYPGDRWIEPILPDLLGEHLVQREMENGADELLNLVLGPAQL